MLLLKKRYWLSIALLLTVVFVLRTLPATWAIYAIQQAAPGFQVSEVSGSLWSGRAAFSQWLDRGQALPLGRLDWQLQGLSLFSLNPCVDFSTKMPQQSIAGYACYSLFGGAVSLHKVDIGLPISQLSPYINVDLEGRIDAYIKKASLDQNYNLSETSGNVLWQGGSLYTGNEWVFLGDIQAQFYSEDNRLVSQWLSVEGQQGTAPVDIDVQLTISNLLAKPPNIQARGVIKPGPQASGLVPMLRFIGEPGDEGSYRIDLNE